MTSTAAASAIVLLPAATGLLIFAMPSARKCAASIGALGSAPSLACVAGLAPRVPGGCTSHGSGCRPPKVESAWRVDVAVFAPGCGAL